MASDDIQRALRAAGLRYRRMPEAQLLRRVAQDLADGKIVGWFQGRFEMGPRALGNRSILADPRRADMRDILNAKVKKREAFRPFAPAVLLERRMSSSRSTQPDPFMTLAPRVRPTSGGVIPAAVHVDGTGRIQTVERSANPRYYGLIEEFGRLTGVPVLLNTSFNRKEPIVARPEEAIACYPGERHGCAGAGRLLHHRSRHRRGRADADARHRPTSVPAEAALSARVIRAAEHHLALDRLRTGEAATLRLWHCGPLTSARGERRKSAPHRASYGKRRPMVQLTLPRNSQGPHRQDLEQTDVASGAGRNSGSTAGTRTTATTRGSTPIGWSRKPAARWCSTH